MQILLMGATVEDMANYNHIKISKPPMLWQKKSSGLCDFFRASKFCLLPALWGCDEKNFLRRQVVIA